MKISFQHTMQLIVGQLEVLVGVGVMRWFVVLHGTE